MIQQQVEIGKGTLKEFKDIYDRHSQHNRMTIKASTLFPVGKEATPNDKECAQIYEFAIYFDEVSTGPSTDGKHILPMPAKKEATKLILGDD